MKNDLKLQAYENKSKSKLVAYILLILLGTLGIHRFYLRRYLTASIIFILTGSSIFFDINGETQISNLLFVIPVIYLIVDLFLIPKMVKSVNLDIALNLGLDTLDKDIIHTQQTEAEYGDTASKTMNGRDDTVYNNFEKSIKEQMTFLITLIKKDDLTKSDIQNNIDVIIKNDDRMRQGYIAWLESDALSIDKRLKLAESTKDHINTLSLHMVMLMVIGGLEKAAEKKVSSNDVSIDTIKDGIKDMPIDNLMLAYANEIMQLHQKIELVR